MKPYLVTWLKDGEDSFSSEEFGTMLGAKALFEYWKSDKSVIACFIFDHKPMTALKKYVRNDYEGD